MLHLKELELCGNYYDKKALLYTDTDCPAKAVILYFHGGGLLYGDKADLPDYHVQSLTRAGYAILSFDYPLAPAVKLPQILSDVCESVNYYIENRSDYFKEELPYFLWGRSAGAYLSLIAAASQKLKEPPNGLLSYYGYGFLCDNWFHVPSSFYCKLPPVSSACLHAIPAAPHAGGDLDTHYSVYVYARQQGVWKDLIYEGREKFFFLDYSLRLCETFPCPLFCAHSIGDTDVPYEEFLALSSKYNASRFIATCNTHDFDRDTESALTHTLIESTITFLDNHL